MLFSNNLPMLLLILFSILYFNFIIIFTVVDFTAIFIDIYFLAVANVINVTAVVVAIASFVVNDMIVDTGIFINICSTTFFHLHRCQKFLMFLFWIDPSTASRIFDVTTIFIRLLFSISSSRKN